MADETATNPVEGGDTFELNTAPETQEVEAPENQEPELDEDGNLIERAPEDEEIEFEDLKLKVPKDHAQKVREALLRQADYTRKTQEVAEQRKALQAERQTIHQASEQEVAARAQVVALDQQLAQYQQIDWAGEMQAARQAGDYDRMELLQVEHARFSQLRDARGQAANQYVQLSQQRQLAAQQETAKRIEEGRAVLARDIPGWSTQLAETLLETGIKQYGFERAEIEEFSDPRMVKVLHDAHQYQLLKAKTQKASGHVAAQAAKPAAKVGGAGPKPGLDERLSTDEWIKRREAQVRKRA